MISRRHALLTLPSLTLATQSEAGLVDWYNGVKVGSRLPAHEAHYISGAEQKGAKLTLIDFWATWCAPCLEGVPHLNGLHAAYKDKGVAVVGFTQESVEVAKPFLPKARMNFSVAAGSRNSLQAALGIKAIPYALFTNAASVIVWRGQPNDISGSLIESLLRGAA